MASLACTSMLSVSCDIMLVTFAMVHAPLEQSVVEEHGSVGAIVINNGVNCNLFLGLGVIAWQCVINILFFYTCFVRKWYQVEMGDCYVY